MNFILKTFIRTSVFSAVDLHWAGPQKAPARNTTHLRTSIFRIYSLVKQHVLLHWNSTKLPFGMQRIWGPFVLKTIVIPYETLWACLHGGGGPQVLGVQIKMRDCMDRRPGYSNNASYLTYLGSPTPCKQALTHFLNLWYILSHSCAFHSFCFTPIFSYVYYHAKYFSYPSWCCSSAKARNYNFIFNFSSQRPQLNYILLSKVYSFDTMEFLLEK